MSSFENTGKIEPCFRRCSSLTALHYQASARNGTQTEPRLPINVVHFKTLHFIRADGLIPRRSASGLLIGAGKSWKVSELWKSLKLSLRSLYNFGVQVPLGLVGRYHSLGVQCTLRSECSVPSARSAMYPPFGVQWYTSLDTNISYRSVLIYRTTRCDTPDTFSSKVFMRVLTLVKTRVGGELV